MSGLNAESIKVTFKSNKIIAELSMEEDGITSTVKLIFIKMDP
jgi:hypothetical protein